MITEKSFHAEPGGRVLLPFCDQCGSVVADPDLHWEWCLTRGDRKLLEAAQDRALGDPADSAILTKMHAHVPPLKSAPSNKVQKPATKRANYKTPQPENDPMDAPDPTDALIGKPIAEGAVAVPVDLGDTTTYIDV
jgi:hypothetical protein